MTTRRQSRHASLRRTTVALVIAASFPCAALAQVDTGGQFFGLGTLGGAYSWLYSGNYARTVSADGTTASGYSYVDGSHFHAFRWTVSGGMQDLGTLGGGYSYARGLSADGSTVIGSSNVVSDGNERAFRWTAAGGMVNLGTLGGDNSIALGVSGNGSVVVGRSNIANNAEYHAFRWEAGGAMQDLGTLGGNYSVASAVSGDGVTVVGQSNITGNNDTHAFRWTQGGGMQNLGTLGGTYSYAYGVSANGSVVVGRSRLVNNEYHAFRWTQPTGLVDLGTLGGNDSDAYGMNPDGSVVVGVSNLTGNASANAFRWTQPTGMQSLGTLGGTNSYATGLSDKGDVVVGRSLLAGDAVYEAFRWTTTGGMQSVRDWLTSNGVSIAEGWRLADGGEVGTNATGNIVVGQGRNANNQSEIWFARVGPFGSGAVTLAEVQQSLVGTSAAGHMVQAAGNTVLNGAHSRPLDRRVAAGQKTFWLAGDWGTDDHGERHGNLGLAEVGLGINLGTVQWNAALGQTWAKQDLPLKGHANSDGTYLLVEGLVPVSGKLWATFGAYAHTADTDLRRAYLNAGELDASTGRPAVNTWALRGRLEWDKAYKLASTDVSPYVDLSYTQTTMDAYTETGGGFPARFDARKDKATEVRVGVNLSKPLSGEMRLLGTLEAAHRFEAHGGRASGEVIGLFAFDLDGVNNQRDWLRLGAGVEGKLAGGIASLTLNLTSKSEAPSAWLGLRWQKAF